MDRITRDYRSIWQNCLDMIREIVPEQAFNTWFLPIEPVSVEKSKLTIQVPSHLYYEFLEEHYKNVLKTVIRKELGAGGKLMYRVVMEKRPDPKMDRAIVIPPVNRPAVENPPRAASMNVYQMPDKDIPNPFVAPGIRKQKIPSNLDEALTFENYVEGDCNRLARSAGWVIAKSPGKTSFNPLFVYSDVGLGKSHLVNAVGIQIKSNFPDKVVLYVNSDSFYQQFIEAVKNRNLSDFIWFYQSVDVLIIDDIQFISGGKEKTQEAFFHIFDRLLQRDKQVIITSDKSPDDHIGFEPRLLNRFKWGLIVELQVPDHKTRVAIINKKLENGGIVFPKEVIEYLALRITTNTRELEGAMIAILAQATLNHREINVDLAREIVDTYVKDNSKEISIEYIKKVVCDYFGIQVEVMEMKTRKRSVVQPRQLCMFFAKKYTKLPLSYIGKCCGGMDHATVLHAYKTIRNLCETDDNIRKYVDDLDKEMKLT